MTRCLALFACVSLCGCVARGSPGKGEGGGPTDGSSLEPRPRLDRPRPTPDRPRPKPDKAQIPPPKDWYSPPPDKPKPPDQPKPPDIGQPDKPPPVCKDPYEPNNNCSAARSLGSMTQGGAWVTKSATSNPATDVDWYSAKGLEKNHSCIPGFSQSFYFKVRVQVPAGRTLRACVYKDGCAGNSDCKVASGPSQISVQYKVNGICALTDDTEARILVQNQGSAAGCDPYSVSFSYDG